MPATTVTRTVIVEDTSVDYTLIGDTNVTHEAGSDYTTSNLDPETEPLPW